MSIYRHVTISRHSGANIGRRIRLNKRQREQMGQLTARIDRHLWGNARAIIYEAVGGHSILGLIISATFGRISRISRGGGRIRVDKILERHILALQLVHHLAKAIYLDFQLAILYFHFALLLEPFGATILGVLAILERASPLLHIVGHLFGQKAEAFVELAQWQVDQVKIVHNARQIVAVYHL